MINDDAVAFFEAFQAFALFHDLSAGFVTCYHSGDIPLRSFSGMLPVNAADIASADGCCLCFDQYLTVTRLRNLEIFYLHRGISRKDRTLHQHFNRHTSIPLFLYFSQFTSSFDTFSIAFSPKITRWKPVLFVSEMSCF